MYRIITTNSFDKEVVKCMKRGLNLDLLQKAISMLENTGSLPHRTDHIFYQGIIKIIGNAI